MSMVTQITQLIIATALLLIAVVLVLQRKDFGELMSGVGALFKGAGKILRRLSKSESTLRRLTKLVDERGHLLIDVTPSKRATRTKPRKVAPSPKLESPSKP